VAVDRQIKPRLVGAVVLVSLVVIFVPMLLEDEPVIEPGIQGSNIPPRPAELGDFPSGVLPLPGEDLGPEPPAQMPEPEREPVSVVKALSEEPESVDESKGEPAEQEATEESESTMVLSAAPEPVKPRVGISAWAVQVGSFERRGNAQGLVERLRAKGQEAFIEEVEIGRTSWYRVRVGPELDRKKADRMLTRVRQVLGADGRHATVVRYP
jgi:DedD protein